MSRRPIVAAADTPARDVVDMLYEHDIRHVPVVRDGSVVGVVSDRDLRNLIDPRDVGTVSVEGLLEIQRRPISEMMSSDVVSVTQDSDITKAAELMVDHGVGSVLVIDSRTNHLEGIVSYTDILKHLFEFRADRDS